MAGKRENLNWQTPKTPEGFWAGSLVLRVPAGAAHGPTTANRKDSEMIPRRQPFNGCRRAGHRRHFGKRAGT